MSLVRDLKERRVPQILIGYLAAGWIAVEAADQLVGNDFVPQVVYNITLVWYLALIPAVATVGWVHGEQGDQKVRPLEVVVVGLIVVALAGFSFTATRSYLIEKVALSSAAEGLLPPSRVAVLYFEAESDSLAPLADGFTESLIGALKGVRALDVVSANGVEPFRHAVALDSVATALQAGTLVRGMVRDRGGRVAIEVGLVDGASGAEYRRTALVRPLDEVLEARDELSGEVARFLRERLGDEIEIRRTAASTEDVNAWALYQQAERLRKQGIAAMATDPEAAWEAFLRGDSLLAVVERLDEEWSAAPTLRARLAYRRSRMLGDPDMREAAIHEALEHAERALSIEPDDAAALEYRGTTRYWRFLTRPDMDEDERIGLLADARADLERAVVRDPTRASAFSTLSHLYYNDPDGATSAAALAAQRAYEEDAYLDVADEVLWRLYSASLDMGEFRNARKACNRGADRFPGDFRFVDCRLRLMLTPALDPDPDEAWRLAELATALAPEPLRPVVSIGDRMFVAGALGRAGLADSAQSVLERASAAVTEELDPEGDLLLIEAAVRAQLGDAEEAIAVLQRYSMRYPEHSFAGTGGLAWWWRGLEQHPDFRILAAMSRDRR